MIIYKIRNKINGMSYIGQTIKNLEYRIAQHLKGVSYLSSALRKYGINSFDISIIDCANNIDILNEKEEYWISYYNTVCPKGYNMTYGGFHNLRSRETCRKISESKTGKKRKPEVIRKIVETRRRNGSYHNQSDEIRENCRNRWRGLGNPSKRPEVIKKIIETKKRKGTNRHSEKAKSNISKSLKGRISGFRGKHHSEEAKQKNRKSHLGKKYGINAEADK